MAIVKIMDSKRLNIIKDCNNIDAIKECILIHSYEEYLLKGGTKTKFQLYADLKNRGKERESQYIQACDMYCSDIPVNLEDIHKVQLHAQAFYVLLTVIFEEPLRKVDYNTFYLPDFNKF